MEEVYSLVQTTMLINLSLSDVSLVFTGKVKFNSNILAMFEMISKNVQVFAANAQKTICSRYTVVPIRACHGSVLPVTWMPPKPCPYHELTQRVVNLFRSNTGTYANVAVMMTRKFAKSRRLRNSNQIQACLYKRFKHVKVYQNIGLYSIRAQIAMLQDARLLLGPHGAGLTQLLWLPPGAHVIEITPQLPFMRRSVANIYANMAAWSQHSYRAILEPAICENILKEVDSMRNAVKRQQKK